MHVLDTFGWGERVEGSRGRGGGGGGVRILVENRGWGSSEEWGGEHKGGDRFRHFRDFRRFCKRWPACKP